LVAYYMLSAQGVWVQWAGLLVGLVAAVVVFFTAEAGRQLVAFGRDAVRETKKSGLARAKRSFADHFVCVRICGGDGPVFVAH